MSDDLIPWFGFETEADRSGPVSVEEADRLRKALLQPAIPFYGEVHIAAAYRYRGEHLGSTEAS